MWPQLIGAGVSLLGGLMGSSAEKKAQKQQAEIAKQNLAWDKEKFEKQWAEILKQQAEGKLGYTDARGNKVRFVEGVGWVTELTPYDKMMQLENNREEETQLAQDVPAGREKMFGNIAAQRGEGAYANSLMDELKSTHMDEPGSNEAIANLMAARGAQEGMRAPTETGTRQALRVGNSAAASKYAGMMGAQQGTQLANMFLQNRGTGREQTHYNDQRNNLANMYNMFATRASQMPGSTYSPRNVTGPEAARGASQAANAGAINALSGPAPHNEFNPQALMGPANTMAQFGATIGGLGNLNSAQNSNNMWGNQYSNYASSNIFPAAPTGSSNKDLYGPWA